MSVDDSEDKGQNIPVAEEAEGSDSGDDNGGPKLPDNPELNKALEEALASVERLQKKGGLPPPGAELGQKERESLQARIRDLHLKMMEKDLELEAKNKETEQLKDQVARRQADLENYKKRVQREKAEQFNYGNEEIAREFLEVLDNLERALSHGEADPKGLKEGIELTKKLMEQIFQRFSVEPIPAVGEKFDPAKHEAISQMPSAEHEPGTIIFEQQRGYTLKDRLLRPSRVVVAGPPPEPKEDSQ